MIEANNILLIILIIICVLILPYLCNNQEYFNGYEANTLPMNFMGYDPWTDLGNADGNITGRNFITDRWTYPVFQDNNGDQVYYYKKQKLIKGWNPHAFEVGPNPVSSDYYRLAQWLGDDYLYPIQPWVPWEK